MSKLRTGISRNLNLGSVPGSSDSFNLQPPDSPMSSEYWWQGGRNAKLATHFPLFSTLMCADTPSLPSKFSECHVEIGTGSLCVFSSSVEILFT